jgi:rubrerythrin
MSVTTPAFFASADDAIAFAIERERDAQAFYRDLADRSPRPEMAEVFEQFRREEVGHERRLLRIREEGFPAGEPPRIQDLKIADYLVAEEPSPDLSMEEALVVAMKREEAAKQLYVALAERAPSGLRPVFERLAAEETKHKRRFEILYDEEILREN